MMTTLSGAGDTSALNDALRACREANERLTTILANQAKAEDFTGSALPIPDAYEWPKAPNAIDLVGGTHFAKVPSNSGNTTCVYVAGCQGLRSLSGKLGLPLFKIGSAGTDVLNRVAQLNADRYASGYRLDERIAMDPGFDAWKLMTMDYSMPRSADSPVRLDPRALRIKLPALMSRRQFEGRLRKELAPISLAHWLKADGSQTYLAARGICAARVERYTPYDLGDSVRLSPADEIYIFRHRSQMARLCRLCELIVESAARADRPSLLSI